MTIAVASLYFVTHRFRHSHASENPPCTSSAMRLDTSIPSIPSLLSSFLLHISHEDHAAILDSYGRIFFHCFLLFFLISALVHELVWWYTNSRVYLVNLNKKKRIRKMNERRGFRVQTLEMNGKQISKKEWKSEKWNMNWYNCTWTPSFETLW